MYDGWLSAQVSSQPCREAKNIVRWWHFVRKNKQFCLESLLFDSTRGGRKLSVLPTTEGLPKKQPLEKIQQLLSLLL